LIEAAGQLDGGADLGIGQIAAGYPHDLGLLGAQLMIAGGNAGFACLVAMSLSASPSLASRTTSRSVA
jgi:hypothetical protein